MPRILVVDDEPSIRAMIRRVLSHSGFEVEEAADGREAVRVYRARPADLVICDLFMPEKDGLEVLRELSGAKVVVMSGGGNCGKMEMLGTARYFGAAAMLCKPFKHDDLLSLVRQMLPAIPV